jgi:hypothetical protein
MAKFKTYYDDLTVSRNAPLSVIRAAYRALCQKYHPDKYVGPHEEALRIVKTINEAYAVLSNSAKRVEHDQWIDKQEKEQTIQEAQRIMEIVAKTYVAPSVTDINRTSMGYWAGFKKFWQKLCLAGKNIPFISSPMFKRISWIVVLTAIFAIVLTPGMLDETELKTTLPTPQDVAVILAKAKRLVEKGQAEKALSLYLQLAEQGNAEAQFYTGLMYVNGQGIAKNDESAVSWFGKAAGQGYKEAQSKLGFMYAAGKGVAQNYNLAVYWCYQAAVQGDIFAQYNLGLMYEKGQGVAQDDSLAVSWYSKAAAQGDARSQYNLAGMYAKGQGVVKDSYQAAVLYRKAADQGLAEAVAILKKMDQ